MIWIWPEHRVFASMCLTFNQMSEKESYATSRWTFRKLTFLVLLPVSLLLFIQSQKRAVSLNKSQRHLQVRSTLAALDSEVSND